MVATLALSGCATQGLQFLQDDRVAVGSTQTSLDGAVTIEWSARDFDAVGLDGSDEEDRGAFAVLVDRSPMPPGKDLTWFVRDDDGCDRDSRCLEQPYLRERGIYVTTDTSIVIEAVSLDPSNADNSRHHVYVVLVDGTGRRIGESAWYVPFASDSEGSA